MLSNREDEIQLFLIMVTLRSSPTFQNVWEMSLLAQPIGLPPMANASLTLLTGNALRQVYTAQSVAARTKAWYAPPLR